MAAGKTIYFRDTDVPDRIIRKRSNIFELEYISKRDPKWRKTTYNSSYEREYYLGQGNCCLWEITEDEAKQKLMEWGILSC